VSFKDSLSGTWKTADVKGAIRQAMAGQLEVTEDYLRDLYHEQFDGLPKPVREVAAKQVMADLHKQYDSAQQETEVKKAKLEAYTGLEAWLGSLIDSGVQMEANDTSRLHKLFAAVDAGRVAEVRRKQLADWLGKVRWGDYTLERLEAIAALLKDAPK
jgi:pyruvate/2-oxoglutarate dehydrogenase complex dihydrolipoamide acyltransferase (E2) component